jgi:hypothetical protein
VKLTQEQRALEAFGEAWMRMRTIEEAVKAGEGASFVHYESVRKMQEASKALRDVMTAPLKAELEQGAGLRVAARELLALKRGPRDAAYWELKPIVWRRLSEALAQSTPEAQS